MIADEARPRKTASASKSDAHHGHCHDHNHPALGHDHAFPWPEALRIGFVALAAGLVWFSVWEPITAISVIGVAGLLIGGWPIY